MIDIVIPTYKRTKNISLLIKSIEKQTLKPNKISIVYAGLKEESLKVLIEGSTLNFELIYSTPSVCKQRNLGIKNSTAPYILLCDDDIELPSNYLEKLYQFLEKNSNYNIATGEEYLLSKDKKWHLTIYKMNHLQLYYNYIFGLSIYTDLSLPYFQSNFISRYISKKIVRKGNHISLAGWPRICQFNTPVMETTIYGIGASLIRANSLKQNLYNENLPQHGIGENYEVALNINKGKKKIAILRESYFKHHKASSNRVSKLNAYKQRVSELKRVIYTSEYFKFKNRLYFIWSLIGKSFYFLLKGEIKFFLINQKLILKSILQIIKSHKK